MFFLIWATTTRNVEILRVLYVYDFDGNFDKNVFYLKGVYDNLSI